MARVHAYAADALGDHDAVGLAEAIRAPAGLDPRGGRGRDRAHSAGRPRAERPGRAVLRAGPRRGARSRTAASSPGSRPSSRTTPTSPGCPRARAATPSTRSRPPTTATSPGCSARPASSRSARPSSPSTASTPSAEHPRLGPVRSPWSTDHTAGASSAGSAALVAAGAVPLAHANDGGGSIRIPAAVNGLVGLKPTRGRRRPGPDAAPDAGAGRRGRRPDPLGARHRGVPPRGRAGLPRPVARPGRRRHPRLARTPHDRRGHRGHRDGRRPGGGGADAADRPGAGVAGPPRRAGRPAADGVVQGRLPSLLGLAGVGDRRDGPPPARRVVGPLPARPADPRPRPPLPAPPRPAAARHGPAAPQPAGSPTTCTPGTTSSSPRPSLARHRGSAGSTRPRTTRP